MVILYRDGIDYHGEGVLQTIIKTMKKGKAPFAIALMILAATALGIGLASCGQKAAPTSMGLTATGAYTHPWGMALNQDSSRLYVANNLGNSISVFNASSMKLERNIPVACYPRHLVFNGDYSKLYVSHDSMTSCGNSQTTHEKLEGTYVSVIDVSEYKVSSEISLTSLSGVRAIVYDSNHDAIYAMSVTSHAIAVIDASSDTYAASFSITYSDSTYAQPVVLRFNSNDNLLYSVDSTYKTLFTFKPVTPLSGDFTLQETFNRQDSGYCIGTTYLPNSCSCSSDSSCASKFCDTSVALPQCKQSCDDYYGDYPDGCTCTTSDDCLSGYCNSTTSVCETYSSVDLTTVSGYCDRANNNYCYNKSDAEDVKSSLESLKSCDTLYDILPLPDQTAYVTCFGSSSDADADPIYRVVLDENGLSRNGDAIATFDSFNACDKPARMTSDPLGKYAFVICQGDNKLLIIDVDTGDVLGRPDIPANSVDVIASSDYIYVSASSSDNILRVSMSTFTAARPPE